jgi:hypothetical protein
MTDTKQLVERNPEELPMITESDRLELLVEKKVDWDGLVKYLEIQKEAFKKLRVILIGYTRAKDWINLDGTPYLQESGAQAIAGGPIPISITGMKSEKDWTEDNKGKYYKWIYQAVSTNLITGRKLEVEGICTSRDHFFGKVSGVFKAIENVEERSIMEKARTNLYRNAITRVLGLRNITWDELSSANIDIKTIAKVEHTVMGKKTGAAEKAIEDAEKRKTEGTQEQKGYDRKVIETAGSITTSISTAKNMDELKKVWESTRKDRQALPKELFEKITKEKDARKKWLLEREEKGEKDEL